MMKQFESRIHIHHPKTTENDQSCPELFYQTVLFITITKNYYIYYIIIYLFHVFAYYSFLTI